MENNEKEILSRILATIVETVNDAGEGGVPSGYLYAALSGSGMSLDAYNFIIEKLEAAGKIRVQHYVIYST